jgi:hypothetical protein
MEDLVLQQCLVQPDAASDTGVGTWSPALGLPFVSP